MTTKQRFRSMDFSIVHQFTAIWGVLTILVLFRSIDSFLTTMTLFLVVLWLGLTSTILYKRKTASDLVHRDGSPNIPALLLSLMGASFVDDYKRITKLDPSMPLRSERGEVFMTVVGIDLHKLAECVHQTESLSTLKNLLDQSAGPTILRKRLDWLAHDANVTRYIASESDDPAKAQQSFPDIDRFKQSLTDCHVFDQLCFQTILDSPNIDQDIKHVLSQYYPEQKA